MSEVPSVTLNNGVKMPLLGFGVFQVPDLEECERSVFEAVQTGYRLIDTAAAYGNEEAVGHAVRRSGVPRDELFITTKLWIQDAGYEPTKAAFERSMQRLGLEHLDLYLIHWPSPDLDLPRAMHDLARLREDGLARAVGVANFPAGLLKRAIETGVPIAANQVEYHALLSQDRLLEVTRAQDIVLTAYAPLAQGRLASDPRIQAIAGRHGVSAAQVALAWLLRQDGVNVIPKATGPDSQKANLEALDLATRLTDADVAEIDELPKDQRFVSPAFAPDWAA